MGMTFVMGPESPLPRTWHDGFPEYSNKCLKMFPYVCRIDSGSIKHMSFFYEVRVKMGFD